MNTTSLPNGLSGLCLLMADNSPLPMAMVEGARHIGRYVNPAFCHLFGKSELEIKGQPFVDILPKHDKCRALLDRVFASGEPASHTEEEHSQTHPFFWSYTVWPVKVNGHTIGSMIQVTETAERREKTLALNEELMLSAVRQHEMLETADKLNGQLLLEINRRTLAEDALYQAHARLKENSTPKNT
jgi:PAS domain S-box-containing protein